MTKVERYSKLMKKMIQTYSGLSKPSGYLDAKYMLVGIRPSHVMSDKTRTNDILLPIVNKYFDKNYYFTNLVKYPGNSNCLPDQTDVDNCITDLIEEILIIKPKKIIALGNWVHETLSKNSIVSTKVFHPAFIARTGKNKEYEQQIEKIIKKDEFFANENVL
jgi:uracil-DNA glycosylase family 4